MKYKSNNNVTYSCKYHVVFCPKYRRPVLVDGVDDRLKELIKETCDQLNVEIIEMEIMPDHVHLLMEVDPQYGIHKAVKRIKGYSSRVLRQEFPWLKSRIPTLWTNSYFVSTVGGAPLSVVKLERLQNIRSTTRTSRKNNHSLHTWSFYRLATFIEYKAKLAGIEVEYVDPAYTSQICPICGRIQHANDRNYTCRCGYQTHRDLLGAINICNSTEYIGNRYTA